MREDDRGFWELQRSGALMPDVRQPRRFEIVRYAEKQVVTYEV
jgi:hypothetical protein